MSRHFNRISTRNPQNKSIENIFILLLDFRPLIMVDSKEMIKMKILSLNQIYRKKGRQLFDQQRRKKTKTIDLLDRYIPAINRTDLIYFKTIKILTNR